MQHDRKPSIHYSLFTLMLLHRKLHIVMNRKYQKTGSCAENRAGDTVVPVPATVLILNVYELAGGALVPFFPGIATLH